MDAGGTTRKGDWIRDDDTASWNLREVTIVNATLLELEGGRLRGGQFEEAKGGLEPPCVKGCSDGFCGGNAHPAAA